MKLAFLGLIVGVSGLFAGCADVSDVDSSAFKYATEEQRKDGEAQSLTDTIHDIGAETDSEAATDAAADTGMDVAADAGKGNDAVTSFDTGSDDAGGGDDDAEDSGDDAENNGDDVENGGDVQQDDTTTGDSLGGDALVDDATASDSDAESDTSVDPPCKVTADCDGIGADTCDPVAHCSPAGKCEALSREGQSCPTAELCAPTAFCKAKVCAAVPKNCDDGNACTADSCDANNGSCGHKPLADAASCEDGNACTAKDICKAGVCTAGAALDCADAKPCTADTCDPKSGCKNAAMQDGSGCQVGACLAGGCVKGECSGVGPVTCTPGPCQESGSCTEKAGGCAYVDAKDGTTCGAQQVCSAGKCVAQTCTVTSCDDGNPCTSNVCDQTSGKCVHTAKVGPCDDKDKCTTQDTCADGKCGGVATKCADDGNTCTTNTCNPATGSCVTTAIKDGAPCSDGNVCNADDACEKGTCAGAEPSVKTTASNDNATKPPFKNLIGIARISGGFAVSDRVDQRLRKIGDDGSVSVLAGTGAAGSKDGAAAVATFNGPADLAATGTGTTLLVWVADNNNHAIRSVSAGIVSTAAGAPTKGYVEGKGGVARFNLPSGIAAYGGKLYITDSGNHRIRSYDPTADVTSHIAGSGNAGLANGAAKSATFNVPRGIAADAKGNLYVTESNNHTVRRIDMTANAVTTFAGTGKGGDTLGDALATAMQQPMGVAVSADGSVFVSDYLNARILRIFGGKAELLVGHTATDGDLDGPLHVAKIDRPAQITFGPDGALWFTDEGKQKVRRATLPGSFCDDGNVCTKDHCSVSAGKCLNEATTGAASCDDSSVCTAEDVCSHGTCTTGFGAAVTTFAGDGTDKSGTGNKDAVGLPAVIAARWHGGDVYFALDSTGYVGKVDSAGKVSLFAKGTSMWWPQDIVIVGAHAYISVYSSSGQNYRRILKMPLAGGAPEKFCGDGVPGSIDGACGAARFQFPAGMAHGPDGLLYVADVNANRIRTVDLKSQKAATLAGGGSGTQTKDGPVASAVLIEPRAIAFASDGALWFTQSNESALRRIKDGAVLTVVGGAAGGAGVKASGWADGPADTARLQSISGLTIVPTTGAIVWSEADGGRVRQLLGLNVQTLAGSGAAGYADGGGKAAAFNGPRFLSSDAHGRLYVADRQNNRIRLVQSSPLSCDDGKPCTIDACDSKKGCVFKAVAVGGGCDDGNPCTKQETCDLDGKCGGGKPDDCSDGDACGVDSCNPKTGCKHSPVAALVGKACDDNDLCTSNTFCSDGKCAAGVVAAKCDDSNPCTTTTDTCVKVDGTCSYASVADGTHCGANRVCGKGKCALDPTPAGMTKVSAGQTLIGCKEGDKSCSNAEKPLHPAKLSGFWLDTNEVTVAQYRACITAGQCAAPKPWDAKQPVTEACNFGRSGYDSHPVNCVSWPQATAYCSWLGKRLPTSAEWEYAARGPCADAVSSAKCVRLYPWGEAAPTCQHANKTGCTAATTIAVGGRDAGVSATGVRDMAGNVWEWTADWHDASYYGKNPPLQDPLGPATGSSREVRGGAFNSQDAFFRASFRSARAPETLSPFQGFRCAQSD